MDLASTVLQLTGATSALEIAQGHQSRVFDLLMVDGRRLVGKVVDDAVTLDVVATRAAAVAELADLDSRVCRPVPIDGSLVNVITDESGGSALLLCSEYAGGVPFDEANSEDAALMGATLAGLHRSLARLAPRDIPEVAALRAARVDGDEAVQLLHGDFNTGNLRRDGSTVKVFDFEDCGYGPRTTMSNVARWTTSSISECAPSDTGSTTRQPRPWASACQRRSGVGRCARSSRATSPDGPDVVRILSWASPCDLPSSPS